MNLERVKSRFWMQVLRMALDQATEMTGRMAVKGAGVGRDWKCKMRKIG